ncbi:ATP-binding protein [Pseudomonas sp. ADAK2]|uniref:AAA family ATPase n=1 Tax=unclassified Pseudomonas TaxID=196821 RepID=UPI0014638D9D|nr:MULTISPECIES: AAA family ATPase [unclassified Pseudomonas]QJI40027.1 ATP-binding protein [Pseudomonas sp. ADAK7]QJI46332.1 ATP-binding protein [Pseudomonas sp. ADAK2]
MNVFDPSDLPQRDNLLNSHPIRKKSFTTLTQTIERAYGMIREQIWLGRPSLYFYSTPRMGKSQCALAIKHLANQEFPDKFVVLVSCDVSETESIVESMAKSLSLMQKSRENLAKLRGRLTTHIACELSSLLGSHFLLILDEMQALDLDDYKHLQVIQNDLKISGIATTTIGFAQSDINSRHSSFRLAKEDAILARFLSQRIAFEGCTDEKWLTALLENFDSNLIYPPNSDCSYTRFFLPNAFADGFRLSAYAPLIFKIAKQAVGGVSVPIPIEHLFITIEYLLISSRVNDTLGFELSSEVIASAIAQSNMAEFSSIFK